jgi:hypothetical protein
MLLATSHAVIRPLAAGQALAGRAGLALTRSLFALSARGGGDQRAVWLAGASPDRARGDADDAFEGAAEGGLGPVAEPVGELADRGTLLL